MKSLMRKTLTQFALCVAVLLLVATPLFYWLTKSYYAEDLADVIAAVGQGRPVPTLDLEGDIMAGVMLQFGLIAAVLGVAIVVMLQVVSRRLWAPFNATLRAMGDFSLEQGRIPALGPSDVREFDQLNRSLTTLMQNSLNSYRLQKEFTENASHELQTPLAIFQGKLELLMQQPDISERQAAIIGELGQSVARLTKLNRNLLLLAKIENRQYERREAVNVTELVGDLLAQLDAIAGGDTVRLGLAASDLTVEANRPLMESMVTNLVVNAVRHSAAGGAVVIDVTHEALRVSNVADGGALDPTQLFSRFSRPTSPTDGNGLGLAIVKSVCDYHGWRVAYAYEGGRHVFMVDFFV